MDHPHILLYIPILYLWENGGDSLASLYDPLVDLGESLQLVASDGVPEHGDGCSDVLGLLAHRVHRGQVLVSREGSLREIAVTERGESEGDRGYSIGVTGRDAVGRVLR